MNMNTVSPYVRLAIKSRLLSPFYMRKRVIFDYELIFVEQGRMKIIFDDGEYVFEENEFIFLSPGVRHIIKNADMSDVSQPHVHFDLHYDYLSENIPVSFKDISDMTEQEREWIRKDELKIPPRLSADEPERLKELLFLLIEEFKKQEAFSELRKRALMLEMLSIIFRSNGIAADIKKPDMIEQIKEYIDYNFLNNITLDGLEKQFHYSRYYIVRQFKKTYGITLKHYYNNLRLDGIKKELLSGESITAVSEKFNFSSVYSFSRYFKTAEGISPREFKIKEGRLNG